MQTLGTYGMSSWSAVTATNAPAVHDISATESNSFQRTSRRCASHPTNQSQYPILLYNEQTKLKNKQLP